MPYELSGHRLSEPKFQLETRFRAWRSRILSNYLLPPVLVDTIKRGAEAEATPNNLCGF